VPLRDKFQHQTLPLGQVFHDLSFHQCAHLLPGGLAPRL
jgi:hypothetical protein